MRQPLTRRKKLIWKYSLLSLSLLAVATAAVFLLRDRPALYRPGEETSDITRSLDRALPEDVPDVQFTNVAAAVGIGFKHFSGTRSTQLPEDMGSGAAWGDYDNDGDWDLFVCNFSGPITATPAELTSSDGNKLYRNNGDGTFMDVTEEAGVIYKGFSMAAAWGDYDGDGNMDLIVTNYGDLLLYRNNGDGTFQEQSKETGLSDFQGFWSGASWGDYDRDGDLDLYICGYVKYEFRKTDRRREARQYAATIPFTLNPSSYTPERNLLFRNNGSGRFEEVAQAAGVENFTGRSLSAAWCDFDEDGRPDLYVANDISDNVMYKNQGDGRFKDISHESFSADYRGAMGLGVGDWDLDGDLDIFITHWIAQENALLANMRLVEGITTEPGSLSFVDSADLLGLGQIGLDYIGWGTSFFDYDNDGNPDLFVANGSTFQQEQDPSRLIPMKNLLFWSKGAEEGFFEVGGVSGEVFREAHVGRGAAFADYDNDGDVDIFVVNHSEEPMLLRNEGGNRNNFLKVRLRAAKGDRTGYGARIRLFVGGKVQQQELGSQSSYLSQNSPEAHFGLGSATQAERIVVRFPSGVVRELENIPANQRIVIEEIETRSQ